MTSELCPCRNCCAARGPMSSLFWLGAFYQTLDEKIERACQRFVDSTATWGTDGLSVEWLEDELDAILGVTHARWLTRQATRKARPRRRLKSVA